ncbi:hypothetical protein GJ700_20290 [Duganella sp. FT92W]|uniref:Uncharacterized protein n=1 Tax=Pseudoduganella rivuli TaxID=2666085 RepID=A0A7X2IQ10_9BURK|nr:hypothetical protein [Pseudoduganella rivuli]MRV74052.1 hypothetical protein [Pseudoduganella rivuli]
MFGNRNFLFSDTHRGCLGDWKIQCADDWIRPTLNKNGIAPAAPANRDIALISIHQAMPREDLLFDCRTKNSSIISMVGLFNESGIALQRGRRLKLNDEQADAWKPAPDNFHFPI